MLSRHFPCRQLHPLQSDTCFARSLSRRAPHHRFFTPLNAVQDKVRERPAKEAKKSGAPDMNAAVTSAREGDKTNGHSKKPKKRQVSSKQASRRQDKKKKAPQEKLVQSGPASSLSSTKAKKKRKKPRQQAPAELPEAVVEPAKKNTVDKQQTGSMGQKEGVSFTDLNPYDLGRRSRAVLESVWKRFSNLGSPGRSTYPTYPREQIDTISSGSGSSVDFETPQAAFTNVLVLGATGKVGRILVRKLLLRGYPVTALVRPDSPGLRNIPKAVRVVKGDLGEYQDLRTAMEGIDKIVYCASSRTAITADIKRVSQFGIKMAAKALQDERLSGITAAGTGMQPFPSARVKLAGGHERDKHSKNPQARWEPWEVLHVGPTRESLARMEARSKKYAPRNLDRVELWINKRNNLVFQGMLINRSAYAATGITLDMERQNLRGTVGLVIRVKGDGLTYAATLSTEKGDNYVARFSTNNTFQNVRIPYSAFRRIEGTAEEVPQRVRPEDIRKVGLTAEYRSKPSKQSQARDLESLTDRSDREFKLEINRIHALPAGSETDFILVSCAGVVAPGVADIQQESVTSTKRLGEAHLRTSGLAYTIVRPGPIIDEPGGYKALVFDQGNRISQSISRADVADVCLKALHDTEARNKTFEVCHEYATASEIEKYELVAHLPDKANSYLTPALSNLESET